MDNFDYKKYLAEGKLLKEEVYKQLGREDLLESVDMDDLKNAKEKLSNPHTILDIIYDKTRRGDKFVRFDYENKHVPGKMWDRGPHNVNVRYDNNKDLKKISKELNMDLKESILIEKREDVGKKDIVSVKIDEGEINLDKEKSWKIKDQFPIEVFVEKSWTGKYYVVNAPTMSMSYDTYMDLDSFGKVDISRYNYKNGEATFTSYTLDNIREWGEKNKDRITINYSKVR